MSKIGLLKLFDRFVGYVISAWPPSLRVRGISNPERFLLIRPGGIGDAALLAPAIHSIKNQFPLSHISILAERRNAGVFSLVTGVDAVLCYDSPRELLQVLRSRFDIVIDTEQWHRLSAVVARLVQAPVKIGYDTNERWRMFTQIAPYSHEEYEAESFMRLLDALAIEADQMNIKPPYLSLPEKAFLNIQVLLTSQNNEPFVTIFPGASIVERRWGADRFRRVAEMLYARGVKIVVVGGKEDRQQGEAIVDGGLGLNLAGITSLSETAAVIQMSSLLVSSDSGLLHIAVGLGTSTVSLFGPGRVKKWAPQGGEDIVINRELPCSPCTAFGTTPPCPIEARCMREITVDEVVDATIKLLSRLGTISPST